MDLRRKQRAVIDALEDIKARDIVVYNTAAMPSMFERVVIASGDSTRQVKALADHVQEKLVALGASVCGVEGEANGEWVLVDFGDVVVHIMHPVAREFYNLEEVWGVKPVRVKEAPKAPPARQRKPEKKKAKKAAKKRPANRKPRAKAARPRRK